MFNFNVWLDEWLKKTLWLWLPFYAFRVLLKEFGIWLRGEKR